MSESEVRVTVRCFAAVREVLGRELLEAEVPAGTTVDGLRRLLAREHPALLRVPVTFAVNRDYARADTLLRPGDEVAFIPPISGGAGTGDLYRFELVRQPIDARSLEAECRTDGDGAVVTFAGTTRDHNDGSPVAGLRYEAYPEMAQKVMCAIFEQAVKQFPITRARVVHRLGDVPVGEASVVVVVSAPHRGPAFDATRFLMDRLKNEVPIFKHERLRDGSGGGRWVGNLPGGGGP
ncbi:MAG TPA: molybdopterin converting factor subunit 1 [Planctomycetota bacterium]|nr:molybdopterin converting factor subunit 1 [Planctomycetota bacterium]